MNDDLVFRPYQPSDRSALAQFIRKTWCLDRFASIKTTQRMAQLFLDSYLANQTYICVAERNGQVLGVIMAKNEHLHRCTLKQHLRFLRSLAAVALSIEGREFLTFFNDVRIVDKALRTDSNRLSDSEIIFFAVGASARGQGLGHRLFTYAADTLHIEGVHNCVLITDTSCNYVFFEHLGLHCRSARTHTLTFSGERITTTFFLYDFHP